MPCTKCEDGKYKWGKTGECEYSSKEACEKANSKYSKMKPTPLGKKTYEEYEKELKEFNLSKVEKVELSVKDDAASIISKTTDIISASNTLIKTSMNEADEMLKYIRTQEGKFDKFLTSLESLHKGLDKASQDGLKVEREYDTLAKELGINQKDIPEYKELTKMWTESQETLTKIDEAIDKMNDVLVI